MAHSIPVVRVPTGCRRLQCWCKGIASGGGDTVVDGAARRPREEETMAKVVRCTCGVEMRDADEGELIERVQEHAREAHDLDLSDEQVRAMMEIDQ
jgi:predicted small metal-binding protein